MMSGSHLSKEFFDLVKSIGESRSKQEEDKIIFNEILVLNDKMVSTMVGVPVCVHGGVIQIICLACSHL